MTGALPHARWRRSAFSWKGRLASMMPPTLSTPAPSVPGKQLHRAGSAPRGNNLAAPRAFR